MDFYSDVDLYVVVRDGAFEDIFAERNSTAEAVGSPLFAFAVHPRAGGSTDHIVVYEGPVKFDFMYLRESDLGPHPRWDGCVVLEGHGRSRGGRRRPLGSSRSRRARRGRPRGTESEVLDLVLVRFRQDREGRTVGGAGWSAYSCRPIFWPATRISFR